MSDFLPIIPRGGTLPRDGAPSKPPVHIGDTVTFLPTAFIDAIRNGMMTGIARELHGRVIYINKAHRYYIVEAPCGKYMLRESFKF